jgi:glutathione S-transferase
MKLYMHPVSNASRPVLLFVAENKIDVEEKVIDLLTGEHLKDPYASLNPNRLVPMLEDGDFRLTESSAILKYLASKFDLPSYPKELKKRAKAGTINWGKERAEGWFKILNDYWIGPKKQYLCGDTITVADYFGSCLATVGEVIRCNFSAYPNVERWLNNMRKLESWKRVNEAHYGFANAVKDQAFQAL